jgi:predicted MFS family arabinose efflux permease
MYRLGGKINALFFVGFSIASLTGVILNNTVAPLFGWNALFNILGCLSVTSLIMCAFFQPDKTTFIPYHDEREYYLAGK